MLSCTPKKLSEEIEADLTVRKQDLQILTRMRAQYAQNKQTSGRGKSAPENPAHEYLSLLLPTLAYDNPRVKATTRRGGRRKLLAQAMQAGLNRWVKDENYQEHLSRMCNDFAFYHGASVACLEPKTGDVTKYKKGTVYWPKIDRVSPYRFACDPLAAHWSMARWLAHGEFYDKDDLQDRAKNEKGEYGKWNRKIIEALATDVDTKDRGRWKEAERRVPARNEVLVWEMWVREYTEDGWPGPDEGVHGGLFTVVLNQSPDGKTEYDWVRAPRPFLGPKWGPYTVYGAYYDADCPMPLGPLNIAHAQIDDLNDHARSIARSCTMYKRLVLVDAANKKLQAVLKSAPDSFIVPIEGLNSDDVITVEVGGVTAQQLQQYSIVKDRVDRLLAMSDAKRGSVTGDGTATENAIADEASSKRMAHLKRQFIRSMVYELRTVGWGMWHNDRVIFDLDEEDAQGMGMMGGGMFVGGPSPDPRDEGIEYDDIELDIEPYSTEYTTEAVQQARTFQGVNQVVQYAQMVPMMPWVDWKTLFQQIADAVNNPRIADVVNVEAAMKMAGGASPFGQQGQPMLSKQAGGGGMARQGPAPQPIRIQQATAGMLPQRIQQTQQAAGSMQAMKAGSAAR